MTRDSAAAAPGSIGIRHGSVWRVEITAERTFGSVWFELFLMGKELSRSFFFFVFLSFLESVEDSGQWTVEDVVCMELEEI